tara:strand:+ start:290 stop:493 length:204 start_codon:yes stop_codon:yes gene_type:complete
VCDDAGKPTSDPDRFAKLKKGLEKHCHGLIVPAIMNFMPVPEHWGKVPQSEKPAPNGTTATEVHRQL